jgi:phage terminase large subunit-like protein
MMGFLAKHLNVELGIRIRANRWPGAEYWQQRGDRSLTYEEVLRRSEVIVVGIDGGGLDDLFGLAVLGRDKTTKDWLLWSHAWCHVDVLTRRRSIAQHLLDFQADGDLTMVRDIVEVEPAIVNMVAEIKDQDLLGAVAADSEGPFGEFVDLLDQIDVTQDNKLLVGVNQGIRLMRAIKTTERRLASGTMRHNGSRLMAWCVGNLKIEATATALRATKANAGDAKIDPAMAMFDAIDIMIANPDPKLAPQYQLFFA